MLSFPVLLFQLAAAANPYEQGVRLIEMGKLAEARAQLEIAVKQMPGNAQAWKALGVAAAMASDYEAAEGPFGKACALNAKLTDACYFHARALYAVNQFAPALAVLARLKEPTEGRTFTAMGQAYEALGRNAEAEQAFQKALAAKDGQGEAHLRYGIFLFRSGKLEDASNALQQAVKLMPKSSEAFAELGRVLYQQGQLEEAEKWLVGALELEPSREPARLLLDKVRRLQGLK